jgi:uncharacterized membrane protein
MNLLVLGMVLFGGPHLFSSLAPAARDGLKIRLGVKRWRAIYGLVTLLGLTLMVWGFIRAHSGLAAADWLYLPEPWMRHVTMLFVLLGFIALASAKGPGHIRLWLQQPMSVGVSLWAVGHLLANGRIIDVMLFGTFLVIALVDIAVSTMRGKVPRYRPQLRGDAIAVAAGVVLYALMLFVIHPYVFGIPVAG